MIGCYLFFFLVIVLEYSLCDGIFFYRVREKKILIRHYIHLLMALLRTVQECSKLGYDAMLKPYATLPYLSSLLGQVNSLEAIGDVIKNSSYITGKPVHQQPALRRVTKDWLHSIKDITTVHLFENDYISCTMFCLPPNRELPIHDHPMMHVLTQVLEGELGCTAYDWNIDRELSPELAALDLKEGRLYQQAVENAATRSPANAATQNQSVTSSTSVERSLASIHDGIMQLRAMPNKGRHTDYRKTVPNSHLVSSGQIKSCDGVKWTRPTSGGVLHSFKSPKSEPVAFIDIITPPYYKHATLSIPCTYFEAIVDGKVVGDRTVIRPLLLPPTLHMDGYSAAYLLP